MYSTLWNNSVIRNCHELNPVKQQCSETIFQLTSAFSKFLKTHVFENPCGAYMESDIYSTLWNTVWKPSFNLYSTLFYILTLFQTTLWRKHFQTNIVFHWLRSVWKPKQVTLKKSPLYSILCVGGRGREHFANTFVKKLISCSLGLKCLKNYVAMTTKVS